MRAVDEEIRAAATLGIHGRAARAEHGAVLNPCWRALR
jgi:hypothetical protein